MKQKEDAGEIAEERIQRLFDMAEKAAKESDFEQADNCVRMAWKIKLKSRTRLTSYQKRLFCRRCLKFLADGKTGKYRTEKGWLLIKCGNCGDVRRFPLSH